MIQKDKISIDNMLVMPLRDTIMLWCIRRCFVVSNTMRSKKKGERNEFSSTIYVQVLNWSIEMLFNKGLQIFKHN